MEIQFAAYILAMIIHCSHAQFQKARNFFARVIFADQFQDSPFRGRECFELRFVEDGFFELGVRNLTVSEGRMTKTSDAVKAILAWAKLLKPAYLEVPVGWLKDKNNADALRDLFSGSGG